MDKRIELREKALKDLQQSEVLMIDGHFDYGNGYHGRVYLNAHQLFRHPSTIWRFAQDLLDSLPMLNLPTRKMSLRRVGIESFWMKLRKLSGDVN